MRADKSSKRRKYKRRTAELLSRKKLARDLCRYIMQQEPCCTNPDEYISENDSLKSLAKWDQER